MADNLTGSGTQVLWLLNTQGVKGQLVRYGISGVILALFYSAVYWTLAALAGVPALIANTAAFLVSLAAGWLIHSRWSFRGHGRAERTGLAYGRYVIVNAAAYGLNSFWVWLIVERSGGSVTLSIVPILGITPWICFWINRRWTFA
ncbi:MAG TPA: GtrA family protein [Allosphingosinicella sp.]|nr:GtrA family protein [Allosphingosinicella sp.]